MASASAKVTTKKRLVPLLEARLNDRSIPELVWIDKENHIFRIPWRHHKPARWGDPDAFMLRELAKVMYNYNGPDVPTKRDLSHWKELLRNNLKTLSDFEELPEMHVLNSDNPYKVYRFISNKTKQAKGKNGKSARECQGRRRHCRRNAEDVEKDGCFESMVNLNGCLDFLDDSSNQGLPPMSGAGVRPCGNGTCDIVNMTSIQDDGQCMADSYTNNISRSFTILSHQDDQDDIFEELFPSPDPPTSHKKRQFNVDALNDIFPLESNESTAHSNISSERHPDYLHFLDDSSSHGLPLLPGARVDPHDNASYDTANLSNSQGSVYQNGSQDLTSPDSIGSSISSLPHLVDEDDLSEELFLNKGTLDYQNQKQFNANALNDFVFDFQPNESNLHRNNFRSRSPLTTCILAHPAANSSTASPFCNTVMGNSAQRPPCFRPDPYHAIATCGVVYNNIPHEVASAFLEMNYIACAGNTEASPDTSLVAGVTRTLVDTDSVTAEDTSPGMVDKTVLPDFSHMTFLSLTRMLNVERQMPLGVEVNYYNSPSIQRRMMPGEFRICFVADNDARERIMSCRNVELFGQRNVHLLELPPAEDCRRLSISQTNITNKILNNIRAGIIVSLRNGDIYATRYCRAGTQFSANGKAEWQKLERLLEYKIFDYNDYKRSYSSQNQVLNSQPFVRLSFAARDPNKTMSVLSVDIWHMEALLLARQTEENSPSLEPDLSLSNEFDKILTIGDMLKK